jgi:hypothetical protein
MRQNLPIIQKSLVSEKLLQQFFALIRQSVNPSIRQSVNPSIRQSVNYTPNTQNRVNYTTVYNASYLSIFLQSNSLYSHYFGKTRTTRFFINISVGYANTQEGVLNEDQNT